MEFLVGLFAFFVAFLALLALWLISIASSQARSLDPALCQADHERLQALVTAQAQAMHTLGREVAALEAELRRDRPAVEILPPVDRLGTAHRAYRLAAARMSLRNGMS